MAFTKGQSGNPEKQFTPENQPKGRGRKPAVYKQLAAMIGKSVKLELTKYDFIQLRQWILERPKGELQQIIRDPETPIWMVSTISAVVGDVNSGTNRTVEKTLNDLFGAPEQTISMTGNIDTKYNIQNLTDDELEMIAAIMAKTNDKQSENSELNQ